MKEIEGLIHRADKLLGSAELLLNTGDYESSVSRSYYAMFYSAEAVLLTKNLKFSSHSGVISFFNKHFVKTGIFEPEMGKRLNKIFEKRLVGDYSFSFDIGEDETREALGWAKEFVQEIKDYLTKGGYLAPGP